MIIPINKFGKLELIFIPRPALQFIKQYAGENLIGAEIGVYRGEHAQEIMEYLRPAKLLLVDTWDSPDSENNTSCNNEDLKTCREVLERFKEKTEYIIKKSIDAANDIFDGSLDFVYIDANHDYDCVKEDLKAWAPKVKRFGVISGHDLSVDGVKKAVTEYTGGKFVYTETDWIFIKE